MPVLFGIFLYFGIVSLSGTQLYERIKLIFVPIKHCPNLPYARGVIKICFDNNIKLSILFFKLNLPILKKGSSIQKKYFYPIANNSSYGVVVF